MFGPGAAPQPDDPNQQRQITPQRAPQPDDAVAQAQFAPQRAPEAGGFAPQRAPQPDGGPVQRYQGPAPAFPEVQPTAARLQLMSGDEIRAALAQICADKEHAVILLRRPVPGENRIEYRLLVARVSDIERGYRHNFKDQVIGRSERPESKDLQAVCDRIAEQHPDLKPYLAHVSDIRPYRYFNVVSTADNGLGRLPSHSAAVDIDGAAWGVAAIREMTWYARQTNAAAVIAGQARAPEGVPVGESRFRVEQAGITDPVTGAVEQRDTNQAKGASKFDVVITDPAGQEQARFVINHPNDKRRVVNVILNDQPTYESRFTYPRVPALAYTVQYHDGTTGKGFFQVDPNTGVVCGGFDHENHRIPDPRPPAVLHTPQFRENSHRLAEPAVCFNPAPLKFDAPKAVDAPLAAPTAEPQLLSPAAAAAAGLVQLPAVGSIKYGNSPGEEFAIPDDPSAGTFVSCTRIGTIRGYQAESVHKLTYKTGRGETVERELHVAFGPEKDGKQSVSAYFANSDGTKTYLDLTPEASRALFSRDITGLRPAPAEHKAQAEAALPASPQKVNAAFAVPYGPNGETFAICDDAVLGRVTEVSGGLPAVVFNKEGKPDYVRRYFVKYDLNGTPAERVFDIVLAQGTNGAAGCRARRGILGNGQFFTEHEYVLTSSALRYAVAPAAPGAAAGTTAAPGAAPAGSPGAAASPAGTPGSAARPEAAAPASAPTSDLALQQRREAWRAAAAQAGAMIFGSYRPDGTYHFAGINTTAPRPLRAFLAPDENGTPYCWVNDQAGGHTKAENGAWKVAPLAAHDDLVQSAVQSLMPAITASDAQQVCAPVVVNGRVRLTDPATKVQRTVERTLYVFAARDSKPGVLVLDPGDFDRHDSTQSRDLARAFGKAAELSKAQGRPDGMVVGEWFSVTPPGPDAAANPGLEARIRQNGSVELCYGVHGQPGARYWVFVPTYEPRLGLQARSEGKTTGSTFLGLTEAEWNPDIQRAQPKGRRS